LDIYKQHLNEHIPFGPNHEAQLKVILDKIADLAGFESNPTNGNSSPHNDHDGPTRLENVTQMDVNVNVSRNNNRVDLGNTKIYEIAEGVDPYLLLLMDKSKNSNVIECSVEEFIEATKNDDPKERQKALRELCPCHVKKNIPEFWDRIIEMTHDPDPEVRYQVLHNLCDGSPNEREYDVVNAIKELEHDDSKLVKRYVNHVLSSYNRTGKWNVL